MKRSAILLPLVLIAATVLADDAPAKNTFAVALVAKAKGENTKQQIAQYGVCDTLKGWGFAVQSKTPTAWDAFLKKGGITVVGKDDKPSATNFTLEGTIEFVPHKVPFYNQEVEVICFIAKVDAVLKDATGKELKKIAWQNLYGENKDSGDAKVLQKSEQLATRFLMRDVFSTKEVQDQIPQARHKEFQKFLDDEEQFWKDNFDPAEKHKVADEKK